MRMTISRSKAWSALAVGAFVAPTVLGAQDSTSQQQQPPAPQAQEAQARTHTVRAGDTLWDLARTYLGDPFLWPEIYRLNTAVVEDPHWIYPGERLRLPEGSGQGEGTVAAGPAASSPFGPTLFTRGRTGPGGESSGRLSLVGRAPRPVVRAGEYYAAPYVERSGGPRGAGKVVASADIPGIAQLSDKDRLQVQDRVLVAPPAGETPDSGSRYLVYSLGPDIPGVGQVVVPTGVVMVERVGMQNEAVHARVVSMYDNLRVGQGLIRLDSLSFPTEPRPMPVELGRLDAKVLWLRGGNVLPSVHQYLVLNRAERDGVKPGDQFTLLRPRKRMEDGTVLPPEQIAVTQVVRVTPYATTAIVIDQAQPAIREGNAAELTAKMP